jgi:hypothetical protein
MTAASPLGPRALADRNAQWQEHNRDWAVWAYETITEALLIYGKAGTLNQILDFFAQKRQSLAKAYRSHEAELFGVWRDERLPAAQRTRTTFFGPDCKPYDKAAAAYSSLPVTSEADAPGVVKGSVHGTIGAETYELTAFKCDVQGADPRNRVWLHTHWRNVRPIMNHVRGLFEVALEPISEAEALAVVAELHWWFVHALPFARGSTSIGEWLLGYVFRARGHGGVRFRDDPAAIALVSESPAAYRDAFIANLTVVRASEPPMPVLPERLLAHYARTGQVRALKRLLLRLPADVPEPTGYTALHLAAGAGQLAAVRALLKRRADVNLAMVDTGETALHLAARAGHWRIVRLLLAAGARVDATDADGTTALHWAAREQRTWIARTLLGHGAAVATEDALGRLPLHYAAERGTLSLVKRLARGRAPAEINVADRRAETPLSLAALRGHAAVVGYLLKRGAQAPRQNPALWAVRVGHVENERAILDTGVDLSLYRLLTRTTERGHGATSALVRARLLKALPAQKRAQLEPLLPPASR